MTIMTEVEAEAAIHTEGLTKYYGKNRGIKDAVVLLALSVLLFGLSPVLFQRRDIR